MWKNGTIYSKSIIPIIKKQLKLNDLKISNLHKVIESNYSNSMQLAYVSIDDLIKDGKIQSNCFKNINCLEDLEGT